MMYLFICGLMFSVWTLCHINVTRAEQVTPCPSGPNILNMVGNYYISDDVNRCVFYWCWRGSAVRNRNGALTFTCPNNMGTAPGSFGKQNLCTERVTRCVPRTDSTVTPTEPQTVTTPTATLGPATTDATPATRTSSPGEPKQIQLVLPNTHALSGDLQPATNLSACFFDCLRTTTCEAFDFDTSVRTCYFHSKQTACGQVRQKSNCGHYRFVDCDDATSQAATTTSAPSSTVESTTIPQTPAPTSTVPTPGMPTYIKTFRGYHLLHGLLFDEADDAYDCLMSCVENPLCVGVDFDNRTNYCFFHDQLTECAQFVRKPYCTHYRLTDQCSTTASPDTSTTASTTTTAELTTQTPIPVPGGFVTAVEGYHILDGLLIASDVTEQQCLDACLMFSQCLAVDYNIATKECFAHNTTTYCVAPSPKPFCRHYNRAPCVAGAKNDIAEVRGKFHTLGGSEVCDDCSVEECLELCSDDFAGACQGVDYDERNRGCYMHTAATVCNELKAKDYCTHYSRVICMPTLPPAVTPFPPVTAPPGVTPAPTGYPAPANTPFMVINFMGPSVIPSMWSIYPGMFMIGGTEIAGPGVTGDACVAACESRADCFAVDFDSDAGRCEGHMDESAKCDILVASSGRYHLKKPPICDFFVNTGVAYPTPFSVAP